MENKDKDQEYSELVWAQQTRINELLSRMRWQELSTLRGVLSNHQYSDTILGQVITLEFVSDLLYRLEDSHKPGERFAWTDEEYYNLVLVIVGFAGLRKEVERDVTQEMLIHLIGEIAEIKSKFDMAAQVLGPKDKMPEESPLENSVCTNPGTPYAARMDRLLNERGTNEEPEA